MQNRFIRRTKSGRAWCITTGGCDVSTKEKKKRDNRCNKQRKKFRRNRELLKDRIQYSSGYRLFHIMKKKNSIPSFVALISEAENGFVALTADFYGHTEQIYKMYRVSEDLVTRIQEGRSSKYSIGQITGLLRTL